MKRIRQNQSHTTRNQAGFSLMEILVVIAIIILIAGLLLGAGAKMKQSMNKSHTKIVLNVCKSAAVEYSEKYNIVAQFYTEMNNQTTTYTQNAPVTFGSGKGTIDDSIELFVYKMLKYEVTKKMIKTLGNKNLIDRDEDGFLEIRDGFDNKIKFYVDEDFSSNDIEIVSNKTYFQSAGIDGVFDTDDDLFSYDQE
ncbi:MAG TPA: hypothetical protein DCM28_00285 [Phycisphaerales bacterium]|nr:hypothetical protein [Phycisphaerales bacterium]|tara:strand:+ start:1017 stop:1601 length:585 start_codon:yes stop_codon:yes gene_type:complete